MIGQVWEECWCGEMPVCSQCFQCARHCECGKKCAIDYDVLKYDKDTEDSYPHPAKI